jgi:hypothetical protein
VLKGLIAAGVDAIGTNHPDVLRGLLSERPDLSESTKTNEISSTVTKPEAGL